MKLDSLKRVPVARHGLVLRQDRATACGLLLILFFSLSVDFGLKQGLGIENPNYLSLVYFNIKVALLI